MTAVRSLYLHVSFCTHHCFYCDCRSGAGTSERGVHTGRWSPFRVRALVARWTDEGWAESEREDVRLTPRGWLELDRRAVELAEALSA